jgi:hypothetical protein
MSSSYWGPKKTACCGGTAVPIKWTSAFGSQKTQKRTSFCHPTDLDITWSEHKIPLQLSAIFYCEAGHDLPWLTNYCTSVFLTAHALHFDTLAKASGLHGTPFHPRPHLPERSKCSSVRIPGVNMCGITSQESACQNDRPTLYRPACTKKATQTLQCMIILTT